MTSASRSCRSATLVVAGSLALALPAGASVVRVLESDERHVLLEIRPTAPRTDVIRAADGASYVRLTMPDIGMTDESGRPEVPIGSARVALPPGTVPRLRILQQEWSPRVAGAVMPVPARVGVREPFGPDYVAEMPPEEGDAYRATAIYPEEPFRLSEVRGLRDLRVVDVEFAAVRAEVFARAYRTLTRAVLEVTFEPAPGREVQRATRPVRHDELWQRTTRGGVLNADQARGWARGGPGDAAAVGNEPWGPGDQWKIEIPSTGLAEVGFATLAAAGFPSGISIAQVAIYQRTFDLAAVDDPGTPAADLFVALPVPALARDRNANGVFDGSDGLLFWGRAIRDQWMTSGWEHEDRYDDRNYVWVRIDPAGGARMTTRAGGVPAAADSLPWTSSVVFREEDREYTQYPGDFGPGRDDFESEFNNWNSHRTATNGATGWSVDDPFSLVDPVPGQPATLRARVCPTGRSTATQYDRFTNVVTFSINGAQVGQRQFYNAGLYTGTSPQTVSPTLVLNTYGIPAGILLDGANTFTFLGKSYAGASTGTPIFNARFLFDWYEVTYPRQLRARADRLLLSTAGGAAAPLVVRVQGFSSGADLVLFDVTDPASPAQVTLAPGQVVDAGGSFDLRFEHDNSVAPGRYLATREAAARSVATGEVTRVGAPTLLAGGVGARWVGIAHDSLLGATQRLADYRAARYPSLAAGFSEVCDMFLNGRQDPLAIKSFVAYAYHRWTDPLVFLLLVGDANEDHRGVGVNSMPDLLPSHSVWTDYEGAPEETDQYYAEVTQDGTDRFDDLSDLFVGRLALNTAEEMDWNVERIRIYETEGGDELWRRKVFLLADDAFSGDLGGTVGSGYGWQGIFEKQFCIYSRDYADSLDAHPIDNLVPEVLCLSDFTSPCADSCYTTTEIDGVEVYYTDCEDLYGADCGMIYDCRLTPDRWGEEYECIRGTVEPVVVPEIRNRLNDGTLIWNYQGHANKYFLAHEIVWRDDVLDQSRRDVNSLRNVDRPFIFLGFACHLAEFDRADERVNEDCMSEKLMNVRTPDQDRPAGAIACFASSGFEFLNPNLAFNQDVLDAFFFAEKSVSGTSLPDDGSPGYVWTLGEATTRARLMYQSRYPGDSQTRQAARRFILLGDPALSPDLGSPVLRVKVDGATVENPDDPFFVSQERFPGAMTVEVTASDGRGIVETRVVDSTFGVLTPDQYQVVEDVVTADGVPQQVTITRTFAPSASGDEVRFEAVDAAGKTSAFVLQNEQCRFLNEPVAFPNPFGESTSIIFKPAFEANRASLHIYTVAGRKIREIHQEGLLTNVEQALEWDGRDDHGLLVANGTYLVRITTKDSRCTLTKALPVVLMR